MTLKEFLERIRTDGQSWLVKRLTGNDTGASGSHQAGLYLPKEFFRQVLPEINRIDTLNPEAFIRVVNFISHGKTAERVRAIYYNNKFHGGTRNEFRLTRWGGHSSPNQVADNTGAALIFTWNAEAPTKGFDVWLCRNPQEEDGLEAWLGEEILPGRFYSNIAIDAPSQIDIPEKWKVAFPSGLEIFDHVCRELPFRHNHSSDQLLLERRSREYEIFRRLENVHLEATLKSGFSSVDEFVDVSNQTLNRRKSRAGRSLELHLGDIFEKAGVLFSAQEKTEGSRKPDFVFPSIAAYRDPVFSEDKLDLLGAKTCCKDRWRQILNEAARIPSKHLFTLQEGISANQLQEMAECRLRLVVPQPLHSKYPKEWRGWLMDLSSFVGMRLTKQKGQLESCAVV